QIKVVQRLWGVYHSPGVCARSAYGGDDLLVRLLLQFQRTAVLPTRVLQRVYRAFTTIKVSAVTTITTTLQLCVNNNFVGGWKSQVAVSTSSCLGLPRIRIAENCTEVCRKTVDPPPPPPHLLRQM
ncbi:unnamed protein product, partial [Laminaria digitata]